MQIYANLANFKALMKPIMNGTQKCNRSEPLNEADRMAEEEDIKTYKNWNCKATAKNAKITEEQLEPTVAIRTEAMTKFWKYLVTSSSH